jgi:GNAT superfamily N-acetyltransferase
MIVDTILVSDLTKKDYQRYSRLTLGNRGLMRFYLKCAYENEQSRLKLRRNEIILSISENDKIIAWILMLEFRTCYACKWKRGIHVYTRASFRKRGYADKLIRHAIAITTPKRLYCRGNVKFFHRYGIKYAY